MAKLNQKTRERIARFWQAANLERRVVGIGQAAEDYEDLVRRHCVEKSEAKEWSSAWMADR